MTKTTMIAMTSPEDEDIRIIGNMVVMVLEAIHRVLEMLALGRKNLNGTGIKEIPDIPHIDRPEVMLSISIEKERPMTVAMKMKMTMSKFFQQY